MQPISICEYFPWKVFRISICRGGDGSCRRKDGPTEFMAGAITFPMRPAFPRLDWSRRFGACSIIITIHVAVPGTSMGHCQTLAEMHKHRGNCPVTLHGRKNFLQPNERPAPAFIAIR